MAPVRGLIRLTLMAGSPPLLVRSGDECIATPFGRWMLERVASAMLDWPAVAFHRVEVTEAGLEVLLVTGKHAPAQVACEAVSQALSRELDVAARRGRWVGAPLWSGVDVVVEEPARSSRSAPSLREG
jgi:hypothetical protein